MTMLLAGSAVVAVAQDTVLILPFENRSQQGEYNWIRESFGILIVDVLNVPGIKVITTDERNLAFDKLKLSPNDILTRAAMIRVAEVAQANIALIGEFDVGGEKGNVTVAISARLIETREGRLVGNKVFNYSGPISDLQKMQGQLAWNILYLRNPSLPYTSDQLVRKATSIPPLAYQSLVKAIQTGDPKIREGYLKRGIQEFEDSGEAGHFGKAIFELAMLNYQQRNFAESIKLFKQLSVDDTHYSEGLFYLGLSGYKAGDFVESATAFNRLAESTQLFEVYNNAGVAMIAGGNKVDSLSMLRKAVANSPNDATYRFNYGYALWLNQNNEEAIQHFRAVLRSNPRDGEAHYLLAKCLSATGQNNEAAQEDNEARKQLESYARWSVEPDKIPVLARLKQDFNKAAFYKLERQQSASDRPSAQQISQRQSLDKARQLIAAKNDSEAMTELQRVLAIEATNAEAHYLRGVILQRRGEADAAISAFQSAVSWNPRLIDAHVALGRLYLSRGDRALALAHSKQALEIDPQNRDAVALRQQIETGR
ncbi:MAG: tetratricopeptide repeat protein [Acidobacteria bacterium]|nr:tetratricopeptide repeat protein [Acidobacteriota bacterium]